jgi:hypothetical protein
VVVIGLFDYDNDNDARSVPALVGGLTSGRHEGPQPG